MRLNAGIGGWIVAGVVAAVLTGCGKVPVKPDGSTSDAADEPGCTANAFSCGADDALYQCDADGVTETKVQDCQYGCTNDHCNECDANTTFCSVDDLVQCDAGGNIVNPQTCMYGCQMDRCNTCEPSSKYCDNGNAVTCGANGEPSATTSCGAAGCLGGVCNTCTPNTTTCEGNSLVVCNAQGKVQSATTCDLGCGTTPNAHCKVLVPSYGVGIPSGNLPNLVIDANTTLDISKCDTSEVTLTKNNQTTALPIGQLANVSQSAGPPPICVVRFGAITVMAGFTLTVQNNMASGHVLSLQSIDDMQIAGTITFTNSASGPAPGVSVPVYQFINGDDPNKSAGPGGGGAARAGGAGGLCVNCSPNGSLFGGAGGAAVTTITSRFTGGSAGGNATRVSGVAGVGGRGGGGLQLVSVTRVAIAATGRIVLNGEGGGGSGGSVGTSCPAKATGGGGSGGTLVIEAPSVAISANAIVVANGGGGGGGCVATTQIGSQTFCSKVAGQPGQLSATRAAGGDCTAAGTAGDGGSEANGATAPPINGYDSDSGAANTAGGGGGGSSGFIYLRGRTQADVVYSGTSIMSPLPVIQAVSAN